MKTYKAILVGHRTDDDNGGQTTFQTIAESSNLEEITNKFQTFETKPEQGFRMTLELVDVTDGGYAILKERYFEGEDISGKLVVQFTHQTHLGYAHKFAGAYIAKDGENTSDLNGEPTSAFSSIEENVYNDLADFIQNGNRYKFTTSHREWCNRIAEALDLSFEQKQAAGMDWLDNSDEEE